MEVINHILRNGAPVRKTFRDSDWEDQIVTPYEPIAYDDRDKATVGDETGIIDDGFQWHTGHELAVVFLMVFIIVAFAVYWTILLKRYLLFSASHIGTYSSSELLPKRPLELLPRMPSLTKDPTDALSHRMLEFVENGLEIPLGFIDVAKYQRDAKKDAEQREERRKERKRSKVKDILSMTRTAAYITYASLFMVLVVRGGLIQEGSGNATAVFTRDIWNSAREYINFDNVWSGENIVKVVLAFLVIKNAGSAASNPAYLFGVSLIYIVSSAESETIERVTYILARNLFAFSFVYFVWIDAFVAPIAKITARKEHTDALIDRVVLLALAMATIILTVAVLVTVHKTNPPNHGWVDVFVYDWYRGAIGNLLK